MSKPMTCEQAVRLFFSYIDRALAGEKPEGHGRGDREQQHWVQDGRGSATPQEQGENEVCRRVDEQEHRGECARVTPVAPEQHCRQ